MRIIFLSIISYFLVSCASNINQTVNKPIVKPAESINTIYLTISHLNGVVNENDFKSIKDDLVELIIRNAKQKMPNMKIVVDTKPTEGLAVNINIQELRIVNGATRFMTGALSGKARLGAKLTIQDIATDQNRGELMLGTSSKFSEGVFGGTTGRQLKALSVQVVEQLKTLTSN